jgi:hypothetical protein
MTNSWPEKLVAKVQKINQEPAWAIEVQYSDEIVKDLKKRLDAHKSDILNWQGLTPGFLDEMKKKIQTKVLNNTPFTINQADIQDGGGYVLYYETAGGQVYKSAPQYNSDSLTEHNFVKNALWITMEWIFLQQMELVEQAVASSSPVNQDLLDEYKAYDALDQAGKDEYIMNWVQQHQYSFDVEGDIQNELLQVQNEIMLSLWSVDDLMREVQVFAGDALAYDALVQKLQKAIKLRKNKRTTLTGSAATACSQEIETLKNLLDKTLPEKYITQMTAKYITPNTPKADDDPRVLRDIDHVLVLIDTQLADPDLSQQLRHQRTQKKEDLQNIKEQFAPTTEEQKAKRLLERYEDATDALTDGLRTMSFNNILERKTEFWKQKTELDALFQAYEAKKTNVSEVTSTALVDYKAKFDGLQKVFDAYIARKPSQDALQGLLTKRQQILDRGELNKKGEPKNRDDRREFKDIEEQIIEQRKIIEPLHAAVNDAEIAIGVLPTVPVSSPSPEKTSSGAKQPEAYSTPESKVEGFTDIPETQKKQLKEQFFWQQATALGVTDRWKMRCACNPRHQEFLIAYQKIAFQDFVGDSSRAESLKQLVKERTNFDDAELGSVRDFRLLLKNIKNQKDKEKNKYKYAKKIIPCMFEWAYYQQFNKQSLNLIEAMEANRVGLSAMQPVPSFACACEDVMIGLMNGTDGMWFWDAGCDMLSGIPGIDPQAEMLALICKTDVYKKMMKYVDPKKLRNSKGAQAHPYFYPTELPGTSVHKSSADANGTFHFNPDTGKYHLEWAGDPEVMLALYLQQWGSQDIESLDGKENIRDGKVAHQLLQHWFGGVYDLKGVLANSSLDGKKLETTQVEQILQQLLVDAMKYDDDIVMKIRQEYNSQLNYYRNARQKHEGKAFANKDLDRIPLDQKHRILSAAAARAYATHYRLPNGHPRVEQCLQNIYGWGRDTHSFVQNSNEIVGDNIARIMNERKGEPDFALSKWWWKDFNSIDNIADQIQTHGVFGTVGNGVTAALNAIPGMDAARAQRIGSITWTGAKIAAIAFGIKFLWDFVTKWKNGFWWGLMRAWVVVGGAALFGNDLMALFNGGKGGWLSRMAEYHLHNKEHYGWKEGMAPAEALQFVFGGITMQQMKDLVTIDDGGIFVLKPSSYKALSNNPLLDASQKKMLSMLFGGSDGSVNQMIHAGFASIGITNMSELDQAVATNGNVKLKDYMKNMAISSSSTLDQILDGMSQQEKNEIVTYLNTLPQAERELFMERLQQANDFSKTRRDIQVFFGDHLMQHRSALFGTLPNSTVLQQAFTQNERQITVLKKAFLYGQVPFTSTSSRSDLETQIWQLFSNDATMLMLLQSNDVSGTLNVLFDQFSVDFEQDTTWNIAWTSGNDELFFTNLADVTPGVIMWTKTLALGGSCVTFWLPNSMGQYEEWQLDTIAWTALDATSFGYDPTTGEFGLTLTGAPTPEKKYTTTLLQTAISAAKSDPLSRWGELPVWAYNTTLVPNPPDKTPFTISKTGDTRP